MTEPGPLDVTPAAVGDDTSVVLSTEHLVASSEWVESGRVRLRRRIVAETRTVEVVVRREELVIETRNVAPGPAGESYCGATLDGPALPAPSDAPPARLVLLLREEVPEVVVRRRVYERVTADVVIVETVTARQDSLRHEEAEVSVTADQ